VIERKCFNLAIILLGGLALLCISAGPVAAQDQQQGTGTPYSIQEYNAFQACRAEKDPTAQIKCLDDFVAKFPKSTLMQYVYQLYYPAYYQLKNYKKAVEYADMLAAMGDKIDAGTRLSALQTHCQLFQYVVDLKAADAHDGLVKVRDSCLAAVSILKALKKPENISEEDFQKQVKQTIATDAGTTGFVDLQLKDYAAAIEQFKLALDNNPADSVSEYRIGVADLALAPPHSLDGFWVLARAINMNVPDAAKIQTYLRQQMLSYESPG